MADGFHRLRHDAVVGSHYQHHDVGYLGAAGAHFRKRFVSRGINEGDLLPVAERNLVSADMLGDAAGFLGGDIGFAQGVQKRGLAVVDVSHDGNHRRAGQHVFGLALFFV